MTKYQLIAGMFLILLLLASSILGQPTRLEYATFRNHKGNNFRFDKAISDNKSIQTSTSPRDSNTTLIGRWSDGFCLAVDVVDNIACFGYNEQLEIVDISDPTNMIELAKVVLSSVLECVAISGNFVYAEVDNDKLRIIDISNPTNPTEVGYYDSDGTSRGIAISGNYAYIADGSDGLRIIDISNPTGPFESGYYDTDDYAGGIAVSGNYAYVADGSDGLRIIDISDPTNPTEVGYYDTGDCTWGVAVRNNYAYMADMSEGLRIIDISDPTNPIEVGFYDTGGCAWDVDISGNYAYVADEDNGLCIIDISDVTNPTEVGYYDTNCTAIGVSVSDNYAYVADEDDGLYIIRNDLEYISTLLTVKVDSLITYLGDTVSVGIEVVFPTDSSYSALELSITHFQDKLEFIALDTANSLIGAAGWDVYINKTDTLMLTASGGANTISGSGTLFRLQFYVPDTLTPGFIPIIIEHVLFDESDMDIELIHGVVTVIEAFYGDVSLNGEVRAYDASLILKYLVGMEELNAQQLLNANVSLDTSVSALDASLIFQYVVSLIDILPYDTSMGSMLAASGKIGMNDSEIQTGQQIEVPLSLTNGNNILSFEGLVKFSPEHLNFNEIDWSDLLDDFSIEVNEDNGYIKIAGAGSHPDGKEGVFATLQFTVSDNFSENETIVSFYRLRWNENPVIENVASARLSKVVGIKENKFNTPKEYSLQQNYPNPFNPTTTISYQLLKSSFVKLSIYDINGKLVETLVSEQKNAGFYVSPRRSAYFIRARFSLCYAQNIGRNYHEYFRIAAHPPGADVCADRTLSLVGSDPT